MAAVEDELRDALHEQETSLALPDQGKAG